MRVLSPTWSVTLLRDAMFAVIFSLTSNGSVFMACRPFPILRYQNYYWNSDFFDDRKDSKNGIKELMEGSLRSSCLAYFEMLLRSNICLLVENIWLAGYIDCSGLGAHSGLSFNRWDWVGLVCSPSGEPWNLLGLSGIKGIVQTEYFVLVKDISSPRHEPNK